MVKYYRTIDIFNEDNFERRMKHFCSCYQKAVEYGLECKYSMKDYIPELELTGRKIAFLKYYCKTLFECDDLKAGFNRIIFFLFA